MKARFLFACLSVSILSLAAAAPALALANRVYVSARTGNNLNACDNISTPCQTFAGAVTQLNPDGEVIVLESGGYGPVTITQGVTIEAPAGVTAFVHPPSGDAITVSAGTANVTLRGLTLNVGAGNGILISSVGTLNVENCFITGFYSAGIEMLSSGRLNVKGTNVKGCSFGIRIANSAGSVQASIDRCNLESNSIYAFVAETTSPGSSTTTATHTTSNNNPGYGWVCGANSSTGKDILNLEFCSGSENLVGLSGASANAQTVARYSNCVFANNGTYGVVRYGSETYESRGNNTITGNSIAPTAGGIGSFSPM
jgi:hypothetical protein